MAFDDELLFVFSSCIQNMCATGSAEILFLAQMHASFFCSRSRSAQFGRPSPPASLFSIDKVLQLAQGSQLTGNGSGASRTAVKTGQEDT